LNLRIISVVGARPQFVKLGAMCDAIKNFDVEHIIINTGQHYDENMSKVFFDGLQIPKSNYNLNVGSASHGIQTGEMISKLDPILLSLNPNWVLTYGDTNSTLAAAISAVKLHIKLAHLEAGLRSYNRKMPEEHNRVLTDHASDLLLVPTKNSLINLAKEGLDRRAVIVGDVMTDICFRTRDSLYNERVTRSGGNNEYLLATIHRAENTNDKDLLANIIENIQALPIKVKLVAHPRLLKAAKNFGIILDSGSIQVLSPVSYREMILLTMESRGVITDSGGLQKEAYLLEKTCTTIRHETEWSETLEDNWNILDPNAEAIGNLWNRNPPENSVKDHFGKGDAAIKAIEAMLNF